MNRKTFLKNLAILLFSGLTMKGKEVSRTVQSLRPTGKMPVLFLGHGSPMNAIEEDEFVAGFRKVGEEIEKPQAILCISAHWETKGTYVTAMEKPRTIHDFGGFPKDFVRWMRVWIGSMPVRTCSSVEVSSSSQSVLGFEMVEVRFLLMFFSLQRLDNATCLVHQVTRLQLFLKTTRHAAKTARYSLKRHLMLER